MASNKPQPKKTTAKKAVAKKTAVKKQVAKKTTAKKTPAKKAPAKKQPPKKATAQKLPVKKSVTKAQPKQKQTNTATGDINSTAAELAIDVFQAFTGANTSTSSTPNTVTNIIYANDVKVKSLRDKILKWFNRSSK